MARARVRIRVRASVGGKVAINSRNTWIAVNASTSGFPGALHKTRQDKTRQDKTEPDKARQDPDKTRRHIQYNTR